MDMREIKFRGQRVSNNKFIYGYLVLNQTKNTFIADECCCDNYDNPSTEKSSIKLIEVIPETVGQFTGLKDKNGKDIYEYDFVYCRNGNAIIKFINGSFIFVCLEDMHDREYDYLRELRGAFDNGDLFKFEVIGNIHANPELLNKKTKELMPHGRKK